ncbi:MAG: hypothetical protein FWD57_09195, partial [Polyangiaceae bacterium]|nr:hypothetical protein [Polyangiaceae bacterium]
ANRADCGTASDTLLVISTDGMGIAMQHDDLRESTKRAAEQSKHKLQTRLTPREKRNRKRMAQVATLYSVQRYPRRAVDIVQREHAVEPPPTLRPRPTNKRVWASVQKDKTVETREAFEDAQRRDPKRERPWVVLVDGEPSQLRAVMVESKEHERAGTMPSVLRTSRFRIQYHATNSGSRWFEATASLCQATPNPSPKPNLGRVN